MMEARVAQDSVMINEAVDEFIQDKALWFRQLKKEHGVDLQTTAQEKGNEFLPGTSKFIGRDLIPIQGEIGDEVERNIANKRALELNDRFVKEMEARGSDESSSSEDEEAAWDAETILSTYQQQEK